MKTLATFYDHLLPELPNCTTALIDLHLLQVARDFCTTSRAWRGDFEAVDTIADEGTYELSPDETQAEVVAVHRLTVNDVLLYDDRWMPDCATTGDEPKYSLARPPFSLNDVLTEITLIEDEIPSAAATGGLVINGSMRPKVGATQLPDLLYVTHLEAIRAGVLSRLMLMAKKPWSAPEQGVMYRADYASRTQFSATTAQRGNTRGPLRTRKWG